jgi:hypothetical protein
METAMTKSSRLETTLDIWELSIDELDTIAGGTTAQAGPLRIVGGNGTLAIGIAGVGAIAINFKTGDAAGIIGGKAWST